MKLTQKEVQRKLQRERLFHLNHRFYRGCLYLGYTVGAVGIFTIFFLSYPLWFAIIAGIPLAVIGGLPFGIPLGCIPGVLLEALFNWLVDVFLPELTGTKNYTD